MPVNNTEHVNKVAGSCGLSIVDVSYDQSDVGIFFTHDYLKKIFLE